jgi:hypothetical protein
MLYRRRFDRQQAINALRFLQAITAGVPASLDEKCDKPYRDQQEALLEIINGEETT